MSMMDESDAGAVGGPSPAPAPGAGGSPQSGAGGPPRGGGAMLSALMRQQQGAQVTAPGPGQHAESLQRLQGGTAMIEMAIPGLPPEVKKDVLRALSLLNKHVAAGSPTEGAQKTMFGDAFQQSIRNALASRIAQQGGGQPGQQAPNPATPLPGA